jgi:ATP-binding cassette subfamily B protein
MGFFSDLQNEGYDRKYTDKDLIKRMVSYFKPYAASLVIIGFFLFLTSFASAEIPIFVSKMIGQLEDKITMKQAFILGGTVAGLGTLVWGANWIRRRMTGRILAEVVFRIRSDAFKASANHDLSFYDEFSSGKIVSRITSDTREFGNVVALVADLTGQVTQVIFMSIVLLTHSAQLLGYLMIFLPIVFIAASGFRKWARVVTRKGMRAMGNVNAAIKETISGISVAKNYRQEQMIFDEFDDSNLSSFKTNMTRGFVLSLIFPSLNTIAGIATGVMVFVVGREAILGLVTLEAMFLFFQSMDRFFFPVLNLSTFWTQLQSGLSASERTFALIDTETKVIQTANNDVPQLTGEIEFCKVDFRYTEQEEVLCNFDLKIKARENIALVGHTGAGKSSIAKLVARFYEYQSGTVLIDGMDIRSLSLHEYRKQLGIVSQMPFLFSGTAAENIRYARSETTDDEILELAKRIGNGEWLETLPQGLDTEVGERGGMLSMGQRQLVSLMRVLVQKPTIFILDEATASIDPFTEWQIQQALNLILQDTTSILIAHRLSTVKAADRIIVLEDGGIIEEGNHDKLMSLNGHYADLYNTYFRHQSLAYLEESKSL